MAKINTKLLTFEIRTRGDQVDNSRECWLNMKFIKWNRSTFLPIKSIKIWSAHSGNHSKRTTDQIQTCVCVCVDLLWSWVRQMVKKIDVCLFKREKEREKERSAPGHSWCVCVCWTEAREKDMIKKASDAPDWTTKTRNRLKVKCNRPFIQIKNQLKTETHNWTSQKVFWNGR